jgi:hypothetical protein
LFRKANDLNIERLTWLQWKAALFLFVAPAAALTRISHGFSLIKSWIEMKRNISPVVIACQEIEFES